MGNQSDASAEDEQAVQDTHVEIVLGFFGAEGSAVAHQVDETDGNASIDVEDEVIFLRCSDGLNGNGVVEHLATREALVDEFFHKLDTEIWIVPRFDFVANTGDFRMSVKSASFSRENTYSACSLSS